MYLTYGYSGQAVVQLQRDLTLLCYEPGEIDGIYGTNTQRAVERLQRYNGLSVDGIYGDNSDNALMAEVRHLQSRLCAYGYDVAIDGITGQQTESAIRSFQRDHGLAVDGVAGEATMAKLKAKEPPHQPTPTDTTLKGRNIYICAGHGGSDPGAVGNGFAEAERALSATFMLGKLLQDKGANVMLGRTGDYDLSLRARATASDAFGADIYISWHFNAFGDPSANGGETWYKSISGGRLADCVQGELIEATGLRNRGSKRTDELYELNVPRAVCVLLEPLFITNRGDSTHLSDKGLKRMAEAVCQGVVKYFT